MPKPTKSDEEEEEPVKRVSLTAPIRKCTLEPDRKHPQRLVMIEREKQKASPNLDSWFETGLMRQVVEEIPMEFPISSGDGKNPNAQSFVTGSRPLPPGYGGCDAEKALVIALETGTVMWPIRPSICHEVCTKKPWALYHYTHRGSFEQFHKIFHAMGSADEDDTHRQLYQQLQADYQERVPTPGISNAKGEPMLTTVEPAKFQNKTLVLQHVFGKEATGYSKLGNPYGEFADYCIAFLLPGSACFQTVNQASGANVRFCKDTLEILMKRAHIQSEEVKRKARKAKEAEHDEEAPEEKAVGCLARLCGRGLRRPEKAEFWDEVKGDKPKKKDREMDRWKKRMAKKWLEEHVEEEAKHRAQISKVKDAQDRRSEEESAKAEKVVKEGHQKSHMMEVNKHKEKSFSLGISKMFTKKLAKFSNAKAEKAADTDYLSTASKEVAGASSLFQQYGNKGRGSDDDLEDHEARAAPDSLKSMRRGVSAVEEKAGPTGTKRRVRKKKMEKAKAVEIGSTPTEAMDKMDTEAWREAKSKEYEDKKANANRDEQGQADAHEEKNHKHKQPGKKVSIGSSSPTEPTNKEGSSEASESVKEAATGAKEASGDDEDDEETKKASEADSTSQASAPSEGV